MRQIYIAFLTVIALLLTGTAVAYVGPGAGISVLGALWGLIIGVVMAVGIILFWPIRVMIRKIKANKGNQTTASNTAASETDADQNASGEQAAASPTSSPAPTPTPTQIP